MLAILSCKTFATYWIYSRNIVFRRICAIFRPTDITFHQILLLKCTLLLYLASQQSIRETTVISLSLCAVCRWRRVSRERGWRKKRGRRWRCILCCNKTPVVAGAGNRELKTVASSKVPSDVKQRHRTQEVRTVHSTNRGGIDWQKWTLFTFTPKFFSYGPI